MKNNAIIWSFVLAISIILLIEVNSFEIIMVYLAIMTPLMLIANRGRIHKSFFDLLVLLTLIILIGIGASFFHPFVWYDLLKDFLYFLKPVLALLLGYLITKKINNWRFVFKTIIYLGVLYAIYHIGHTFLYTDIKHASTSDFRRINGLANMIEIFAILLIVLSLKYKQFNIIPDAQTRIFFLVILAISFVFYFSRTMLVGLFLFLLTSLGYTKLNKKGLKYGLYLLGSLFVFYIYLNSADIKRNSTGVESFLYKIKIAPSEIFSPKLDLHNHAALWDHWRAYEAYCAIDGLNKNSFNYVFGKGFGALVDLRFVSPLGEHGMRYIPILHNGYIFILYKTGIVGLLLYLFFLFYLYFQLYSKHFSVENQVFRNIVAGFGLYLLFSTLIITGLYNIEEITPLMLGVFIYLKTNSN